MKTYFKPLSLLIIILLIVSCKKDPKKAYSLKKTNPEPEVVYTSENHPGKKLMETKCYVCHNPTSSEDSRIAPPMVAIKSHYIDDNTTKEEFKQAMWEFVKKPSKQNAKLKGAVKRFGVMPYQQFTRKDINLISDYMFDYKIEEPKWFKKHIETESHGKAKYRNDGKPNKNIGASIEQTPTDRGLEYALNTKKELGKNLMGTIQKKGTLEAVTFCNKKAYPITDSMATQQNASIKRVSDKPRNQNNQANANELDIIEHFKSLIANNESYQPITKIKDNKVTFYAPITTNSMCLQCHGSKQKNIEPKVLNAITSLYPKDKATGYKINEVRGIWSITYDQ